MSKWIEHDGTFIPPVHGRKIAVRYRSGREDCGIARGNVVAERPIRDGVVYKNAWLWAAKARHANDSLTDVIAYRICDDGEEAKRTARMEEFRRIADEALKTDKPVKAPVKERAE